MEHRYHYAWQSRNGREHTELDFSRLPEDGNKTPDEIAQFMGWPGHSGRPMDYLKADVRRVFARVFAKAP